MNRSISVIRLGLRSSCQRGGLPAHDRVQRGAQRVHVDRAATAWLCRNISGAAYAGVSTSSVTDESRASASTASPKSARAGSPKRE